jgi:hypothetical protein
MRNRLHAAWRTNPIALIYFAFANLIFLGGVHRAIDESIWAVLSFLAYWPFSHITHYILWDVMDCAFKCDADRPIVLGLSETQLWIYFADVLVGTIWWWCVALAVRKVRAHEAK